MRILSIGRLDSHGLSYVLPILICSLTVISLSILAASITYPLVIRSKGVEETVNSIFAIHNAIESIAYRIGSSTTIYVNIPSDHPVIINIHTVKCTKNIFLKSRILSDPKSIVDLVDDYGVKYSRVIVNNSRAITGVTRITLTCIGVVDDKSIVSLEVANMNLDYRHLHDQYNTLKKRL